MLISETSQQSIVEELRQAVGEETVEELYRDSITPPGSLSRKIRKNINGLRNKQKAVVKHTINHEPVLNRKVNSRSQNTRNVLRVRNASSALNFDLYTSPAK